MRLPNDKTRSRSRDKQPWARVMTAAGLLVAFVGAHAQDRHRETPVSGAAAAASIFKPLKVGQKVNVEEKAGGWFDVHLLNDGAIGSHTVVELGTGHLVVEDLVSVSRRWIPVTSIRAVIWTRVPMK